jgi:S1-C subfamily serine protease
MLIPIGEKDRSSEMDSTRLFYKVFSVDAEGSPIAFEGTAFPVTPNGGMLTCRHVVEAGMARGTNLAIYDNELTKYSVLRDAPVVCQTESTDIAFLPNALSRAKAEFFPILTPQALRVGESVYSYGFFSIGGSQTNIEQGFFGGKIVNFFHTDDSTKAMLTLPYSIIEGLSGSPVLTYHNGPKVVGLATGNRISRILAAETLEYKDDKIEFKETINRIVEFGTAMHCSAVSAFLSSTPDVGHVVSSERCEISGL